jgi:hypothetical protein
MKAENPLICELHHLLLGNEKKSQYFVGCFLLIKRHIEVLSYGKINAKY